VSYEQVYFVLFFISAASYFILSQTNSYWVIIISLFVGGMGFGLFMPNVKTHLMNAIPFSLRGRLMSGLTTVIFLGQFLSPVISRPLIEAYSLASTYMISAIMLGVIGVVYFVYWLWHRV
jgi:MFS family permease